MNKITSEKEYDDSIANGTTVIKFYADWCPDCKRIDPFMPDVEDKYRQQIKMFEVDRDELMDLSQRLDVFGIPSFIAYKNGKELIRFVSKLGKSRDEIEHFLDRVVEISQATE